MERREIDLTTPRRRALNRLLQCVLPLESRLGLIEAAAGAPGTLTRHVHRWRLRALLFYRSTHSVTDEPWSDEQDELESLMFQSDLLNDDGKAARCIGPASESSSRKRRDLGPVKRDLLRQDGWHPERVRDLEPTFTESEIWAAYERLPFTTEDLHSAIAARRHRSRPQEFLIDVLRVFLAVYKPSLDEFSEALGLKTRTIERYANEGVKLLEQIMAATLMACATKEAIESANERQIQAQEAANERQLRAILTALGVDPVREAEQLLAEEF